MIVADASPLIALARIGQLDLLHQIYGDIVIPRAVEEEITRHPHGFGGPRPAWIRVHDVQDVVRVGALRQELDPGEAEAIILAQEQGTRLLIDEAAGRRVARSLGLEITGTLGALLDAKRAGILPRLDATLTQLRSADFRMSDQLMAELRRAAGEE